MGRPDPGRIVLELEEWQEAAPDNEPLLRGRSFKDDLAAQRSAVELRRKVDIRPDYNGLSVTTTSFVGRIDVGCLRVSIRPKLAPAALAQLLRYAYGLRDVTTREETEAPTIRHGLQDLLAAMLAAEVEELVHRGLPRRYVPVAEDLESPRGRILINELALSGGITKALLPCLYFRRDIDWHLNRVLRAGLAAATRVTENFELRKRLHSLQRTFGGVSVIPTLAEEDLEKAENSLSRLTDACRPALTLIRMLHQEQGVAFQAEDQAVRIPGFLFDMNMFFQRLLSRFLREHLPGMRVEDERRIRGMFSYAPEANPLRRTAPTPRPDFALFRGSKLETFVDAKYRDIWKRGLPADWLYQLGNYAQASPAKSSVILYPTTENQAREERINVRPPVGASETAAAVVILRPVLLPYLAELVATFRLGKRVREREEYAARLVSQLPTEARFTPRIVIRAA